MPSPPPSTIKQTLLQVQRQILLDTHNYSLPEWYIVGGRLARLEVGPKGNKQYRVVESTVGNWDRQRG